MNIEELRDFCLSLPHCQETMPFDDTIIAYKVGGKIFTWIPLERKYIVMKCEPERALQLRDHYQDIEPAYHMNKRHWNGIHLNGDISDNLIKELIQHSYNLVFSSLSRKVREALG